MPETQAGPDNRPAGESFPPYTRTTDAAGKASVTITVTMQPGNNYRAAAALTPAAIGQATQAAADSLSAVFESPTGDWRRNGDFSSYYPCQTRWSPMLTVWRKLHVETDSMVRPTFLDNTFPIDWFFATQGLVPTQVRVRVNKGQWTDTQYQTIDGQFVSGYAHFTDPVGKLNVVGRVVDFTDVATWDEAIVNIADCGGGQSGLACLNGVIHGNVRFSDDDLSVESTFRAMTWGCDDQYASGGSLSSPDLSALKLRYNPAYIEPVHELPVSGIGALTTFIRNQNFGFFGDYGKPVWDQALPVRGLPVSTTNYWTVMVLTAWQPEETRDYDPNSEAGGGPGLTLGVNTHDDGVTTAVPFFLGPPYTGMCAVLRATVGEIYGRERFTVIHEVGHTLGLAHNNIGANDLPVDAMDSFGDGQTLPFKAGNLKKLREYNGP